MQKDNIQGKFIHKLLLTFQLNHLSLLFIRLFRLINSKTF